MLDIPLGEILITSNMPFLASLAALPGFGMALAWRPTSWTRHVCRISTRSEAPAQFSDRLMWRIGPLLNKFAERFRSSSSKGDD